MTDYLHCYKCSPVRVYAAPGPWGAVTQSYCTWKMLWRLHQASVPIHCGDIIVSHVIAYCSAMYSSPCAALITRRFSEGLCTQAGQNNRLWLGTFLLRGKLASSTPNSSWIACTFSQNRSKETQEFLGQFNPWALWTGHHSVGDKLQHTEILHPHFWIRWQLALCWMSQRLHRPLKQNIEHVG